MADRFNAAAELLKALAGFAMWGGLACCALIILIASIKALADFLLGPQE